MLVPLLFMRYLAYMLYNVYFIHFLKHNFVAHFFDKALIITVEISDGQQYVVKFEV